MSNVASIYRRLKKEFGSVQTPLNYKAPHELAIAVILSAQCTDDQVNKITPKLFLELQKPEDFYTCPSAKLEKLIYTTGYYRNKARNIQGFCHMLVKEFQGEIPHDMNELLRMPGIGRKTANVILQELYEKTVGIVVDTHVARISKVLDLSYAKSAVTIEKDLCSQIPQKYWRDWSLFMIFLGRKYCTARQRNCLNCPLNKLCPSTSL